MMGAARVMLAAAIIIAGTGAAGSSNHLVSADAAASNYLDAGLFPDSASAPVVIDDFENIDHWKPTPSDGVRLSLAQDAGQHGKSMRLDFDFQGHGGYAVIHRAVDLTLPSNYEFSFDIRGDAPVNTLEFKLVDASGDNVWWSNQRNFVFPREWRTVTLKKRHITFAWGPIGGGEIKHVAAIEMSVTAGSGGKGSVWIDDLMLTELEAAGPYNLTPRVTASSSEPAHAPAYALDNKPATTWRSRPASPSDSSSLTIDFLKRREFGGIVIDWEPDHRPIRYVVSGSRDGRTWESLYSVARGRALRDYLYLPESDARYVRISAPAQRGPGQSEGSGQPTNAVMGIREIGIEPLAWSASENDFFSAIAHDAPIGSFPKYFSGVESYWTVLGVDGDTREGLVNEQGAIETGKGEFSIEPFLHVDGRLITWHDATTSVSSLGGDLPIKTVTWKTSHIELSITTFAGGAPEASSVYARYRVRNLTSNPRAATLYLAVRPFQVNPPWQFLNTQGGVARVDSIWYDGHNVHVSGDRTILPFTTPSAFGAAQLEEGNIVDLLRQHIVPPRRAVADHLGHASAALGYDLQLSANGEATVDIAVPLHNTAPRFASVSAELPSPYLSDALQTTTAEWRDKLSRVQITLPPSASRITQTLRANLAYILINRDGPGLQPGSRSYERSWIRDGALTSTALLRLGHYAEVRDFIDWYSKFQFDNGKVPCCVDSRGADPVPENDSHGEFIYLVAEYYRHTGDRAMLERRWSNVARAFAFMDSLRQSRMTPEYRTGDKRAFYGLLPQSISHEGYSAKPMHSYWDDLFALRGFKDAAEIARVLGKPEATRYAVVRDEFRKDLYESMKLAMAQHHIDYIPGSVELGDFDATSTTIGVSPVDELGRLPQPALDRTFARYYDNSRARSEGSAKWDAYTPYELRTVGTFVRMGQKQRAHELLDFFFQGQRPKEWRQWAEVVWHDPRAPKFIGDMPHTWVGSDYIRSVLDMFAYERESDSSLVIGAGVLDSWVRQAPGVRVRGLSTHYGLLSYSMSAVKGTVRVELGGVCVLSDGVCVPSGGLIVRSPFDRPIRSATMNGKPIETSKSEVVVRTLPASLIFRY